MIDRQSAEELRDLSLRAVSQLSQILIVARDRCSHDDFERMKKGVGFAVAQIQMEIPEVVFSQFPELNELN